MLNFCGLVFHSDLSHTNAYFCGLVFHLDLTNANNYFCDSTPSVSLRLLSVSLCMCSRVSSRHVLVQFISMEVICLVGRTSAITGYTQEVHGKYTESQTLLPEVNRKFTEIYTGRMPKAYDV